MVSSFMWSGALDLQLSCSSIMSHNITIISHNHHTHLYPLLKIKTYLSTSVRTAELAALEELEMGFSSKSGSKPGSPSGSIGTFDGDGSVDGSMSMSSSVSSQSQSVRCVCVVEKDWNVVFGGLYLCSIAAIFYIYCLTRKPALIFFYHTLQQHVHHTTPSY